MSYRRTAAELISPGTSWRCQGRSGVLAGGASAAMSKADHQPVKEKCDDLSGNAKKKFGKM